jgi:hypothetical protein
VLYYRPLIPALPYVSTQSAVVLLGVISEIR